MRPPRDAAAVGEAEPVGGHRGGGGEGVAWAQARRGEEREFAVEARAVGRARIGRVRARQNRHPPRVQGAHERLSSREAQAPGRRKGARQVLQVKRGKVGLEARVLDQHLALQLAANRFVHRERGDDEDIVFHCQLEHRLVGFFVNHAVRQTVRPGADGCLGVFQRRNVRDHPQVPRVRRGHDGL